MPASISRILAGWKPNGERADRAKLAPTPLTDKLVKGFVQARAVPSRQKGRLRIVTQPYHWLSPGAGIVWIAAGIPPEYGQRLVGGFPREGSVDPDEAVPNERWNVERAGRAQKV